MTDLIVLPRAELEALRDECLNGQRRSIRATGYRLGDILAAAKPVVDAGSCEVLEREGVRFVYAEPDAVVLGPCTLFIAADAAEEGE